VVCASLTVGVLGLILRIPPEGRSAPPAYAGDAVGQGTPNR
jgi:hypothetical protein